MTKALEYTRTLPSSSSSRDTEYLSILIHKTWRGVRGSKDLPILSLWYDGSLVGMEKENAIHWWPRPIPLPRMSRSIDYPDYFSVPKTKEVRHVSSLPTEPSSKARYTLKKE